MSRIYLICALLPLLLFITCEEDADRTVTLEFPSPRLAFSPDTVFFSIPGDTLLAGQKIQKNIQLWNRGAGTVRWTISENREWLTLSSTSGICEDAVSDVAVTALFDRIDDETVENGTITVVAGDDAAMIHVVASKYLERQIVASDSSLEFDGHTDPGPKDLLVRTCGNWESHWTAYSNRSWLAVTPESGTSSGEWQRLTVTVDWSQFLNPAEEFGSIVIDGPNDIGIAVRASWPGPLLCLRSQNIYELWQFPASDPAIFRVARCSPGSAVEWSVAAEKPWVLLSPVRGTSSGEWDIVTMNVDWPINWLMEPDLISNVFVMSASETLALALIAHPACQLEFAEPAAGTEWTAGNWVTIRWKHVTAGSTVLIYLFKGQRQLTIFRESDLDYGLVNDGEHIWLAAVRNLVTGSDYHLEIHSADFWPTCWARSEDFTITVPYCYVTVVRPNVYDRFELDDIMPIHWTTHAPASGVTIDLYMDGALVCNITPWTENDGDFFWPIESCGTGDNWYQVKVTDARSPACAGYSDLFWINR